MEANLVKGIDVYAFKTLVEVVNYLRGIFEYVSPELSVIERLPSENDGLDFFDVRGQEVLIEYIVAAVAGGHNILISATRPNIVRLWMKLLKTEQ